METDYTKGVCLIVSSYFVLLYEDTNNLIDGTTIIWIKGQYFHKKKRGIYSKYSKLRNYFDNKIKYGIKSIRQNNNKTVN